MTRTRRDFLRDTTGTAVGLALGLAGGCRKADASDPGGGATEAGAPATAEPAPAAPTAASGGVPPATEPAEPAERDSDATTGGPRARVVLVRDAEAVDAEGRVVPDVVARMLDTAVRRLVEVDDPTAAWRELVRPDDRAGIKTNVWDPLPTPPALEAAMRARLIDAGVAADAIAMDDRGAKATLADATALIDARPVRTHHWAGIGGCLKNYIPFVDEPSAYHPDACADLGAIWKLPIVRDKTRLCVLVALTPLFYGRGPHHFDRRFVWTYGGLLVSRDPVAVDALGAELLRRKRLAHFGEDRPLTPSHHVGYAETRHGIGVADRSRIDLVREGWSEDSLI